MLQQWFFQWWDFYKGRIELDIDVLSLTAMENSLMEKESHVF